MAWPAHMAKTMGITVDNRAVGGSSLGHAVDLVERAWCEGLLDDPKVLVVIGVTKKTRAVYWLGAKEPHSWMLGHPGTWPNSRWDLPTVLDIMSPDYLWHLHTGYLLRLVQIAGQCRAHLRLFDMFGLPRHIHIRQQHCLARWREILDSGLTCWDSSMESMIKSGERHGGLHPTVAVHQRFGAWAVTQLNRGTTPCGSSWSPPAQPD